MVSRAPNYSVQAGDPRWRNRSIARHMIGRSRSRFRGTLPSAMSGLGVRRGKAAFFSGCKSHPATIAPAGSNRSSHGGNEVAEASGVEGHIW